MLTAKNQAQLKSKGISSEQVQQQIENFRQGFPYMKLQRPAPVGDGIIRLTPDQIERYIDYYQHNLGGISVVKFVPASGAASRMFKDFFGLMQSPDQQDQYPKAVAALERAKDFAFYQELETAMASDGLDLDQQLQDRNFGVVLDYVLNEKGLNYGFLPKGLLAFHRYQGSYRVPMEEHMVEAAHYGKNKDGGARLHFTVSPQHLSWFKKIEESAKQQYEQQFGVTFQIAYSEQKPSTDTIAVDMQNEPFRNDDGSLLFRPGGHGALLENLNEIDGDIIFVKNIDNVVPDHLKAETYRYKRALGGLLLALRAEIFNFLTRLDEDDVAAVEEAAMFLQEDLNVKPAEGQPIDKAYVHQKLNRPIRVCGMVKNEGEPGGGPFWTLGSDGAVSLQIVETSQVDPDDPHQQEIVRQSTHFNPVDLVCSTTNYLGQKFDLLKYRDPNTGFISQKSKDGRDLKALELPGLWNGSMADWNTIFVEVPVITFNPVKTVNDLLRKEHQPQS